MISYHQNSDIVYGICSHIGHIMQLSSRLANYRMSFLKREFLNKKLAELQDLSLQGESITNSSKLFQLKNFFLKPLSYHGK